MDSATDVIQQSEIGLAQPEFQPMELLQATGTFPATGDAVDYGFAPADQLMSDLPADTTYGAGTEREAPPMQPLKTEQPTDIADIPYNGKNYTVKISPGGGRVQILEQHEDGALTPVSDLERNDRKQIISLAEEKQLHQKAEGLLKQVEMTPEEKANVDKLMALPPEFDSDVLRDVVESYRDRPEELKRLMLLANATAIVSDKNLRFDQKYDPIMDDTTVFVIASGKLAMKENTAPGSLDRVI